MSENKITVTNTKYGPVEYLDTGKGPALLSIHGAMGGYDQSEMLARTAVGEGFRVIAVSRPGYLGTPLASGEEWEEQADLCKELLDNLNIKKVFIIAISGGGPCAMHFARKYKSICSKLILCSTIASPEITKTPLHFKIMTGLAKWNWLMKSMQKKCEKDFEKIAQRAIKNDTVRRDTLKDAVKTALLKENMVSIYNKISMRLEGTANDIKQRELFSFPFNEIAVPTLIVHGKADTIADFESNGKILTENIPGAKNLIIDEGEHVVIFTHRETVMTEVRNFLIG